jgi:hypothetical protein
MLGTAIQSSECSKSAEVLDTAAVPIGGAKRLAGAVGELLTCQRPEEQYSRVQPSRSVRTVEHVVVEKMT